MTRSAIQELVYQLFEKHMDGESEAFKMFAKEMAKEENREIVEQASSDILSQATKEGYHEVAMAALAVVRPGRAN